MKKERLKEGWVEFDRWHFKEGHIDRWFGDCVDHPKNETKSLLYLNSFAAYYRLNGGEWLSQRDFKTDMIHVCIASESFQDCTAEEVWTLCL